MCTLGHPQIMKNTPSNHDPKSDLNNCLQTNVNSRVENQIKSKTLPNNVIPEDNDDPRISLEKLRKKNLGRIIIGHLNVNSLRNKFDTLRDMLQVNVDIFMISETKIDDSFPIKQSIIDGYSTPYRLDRNAEGGGGGGGGVIIYIRSDIPCKLLTTQLPNHIEGLFIELRLRNNKWLLFGGYNPKKENIVKFFHDISKPLDTLVGNYENLLIMGDFNSQMEEEPMTDFCETYNLQNLIKEATFYKNVHNPTLIDLILTNRVNSFQDTFCCETGISDYHKMTITVLKT